MVIPTTYLLSAEEILGLYSYIATRFDLLSGGQKC